MMMRTTLDLPKNLLSDAMQVSQIKTKTAVIIRALEELVQKSTVADLKDYKGKVDLEMDLDVLRDRST